MKIKETWAFLFISSPCESYWHGFRWRGSKFRLLQLPLFLVEPPLWAHMRPRMLHGHGCATPCVPPSAALIPHSPAEQQHWLDRRYLHSPSRSLQQRGCRSGCTAALWRQACKDTVPSPCRRHVCGSRMGSSHRGSKCHCSGACSNLPRKNKIIGRRYLACIANSLCFWNPALTARAST